MKLQPSYNAMQEVPAGFEGAYAEQDGKAVFTGGDFEFKTAAELEELRKAKQSGYDKYHETKAKLEAFGDLTPDEAKKMLSELDMLRAKGNSPADSEAMEAVLKTRLERETKSFREQLSSAKTELEQLRTFKNETEKNSALGRVVSKYVSESLKDDAMYIIGKAVSRNQDGMFLSNGEAGFPAGLTLEELVMTAVEKKPHWKKQSTSGHGSTGGTTSAPPTNKGAELQALIQRRIKGEKLSREEISRMNTLAAEIKAARQGA